MVVAAVFCYALYPLTEWFEISVYSSDTKQCKWFSVDVAFWLAFSFLSISAFWSNKKLFFSNNNIDCQRFGWHVSIFGLYANIHKFRIHSITEAYVKHIFFVALVTGRDIFVRGFLCVVCVCVWVSLLGICSSIIVSDVFELTLNPFVDYMFGLLTVLVFCASVWGL